MSMRKKSVPAVHPVQWAQLVSQVVQAEMVNQVVPVTPVHQAPPPKLQRIT